jgi:hypothetical protein
MNDFLNLFFSIQLLSIFVFQAYFQILQTVVRSITAMNAELFCKNVVKEHNLVQNLKFVIMPKLPDVKHAIIVRVFIRLNTKFTFYLN